MFLRKVKPSKGNYLLFNVDTGEEIKLGIVTEQQALDYEEDWAYDNLKKNLEPLNIEVWEFDLDNNPLRMVECPC